MTQSSIHEDGIGGDGASAVGSGESPLMWHRFRPPSL